MSKKLVLVFVMIVFLSLAHEVAASVRLNEAQLLPTESRFIELYNSGSENVNLTGWYIQRKTATGSSFSSLVSKTHFEGETLGAGEYFLISRGSMDGADVVLSSLTLTEGNILQLKNSDGEVEDTICWGTNCSGGEGDNPKEGKSVSRDGNELIVTNPTPGEENSGSNSDSEEGEDDEDADDSSDRESVVRKTYKTKIEIISPDTALAGVGFCLKGSGTGIYGEKLFRGRFYWNFGDGAFREVWAKGEDKFTHTYFYPGEYTLTFEYYTDAFAEEPVVLVRKNIKVLEPEISISNVGGTGDFFVELMNETNGIANLSSWVVSGKNKIFTLPRNTYLEAGKKILIPPHLSGFTLEDKDELKILTPEQNVIFEL